MTKDKAQIFRFGLNGIAATVIHYGVFVTCLEVLLFSSAGVANLFAASVGIMVSFLGNRYFVFGASEISASVQFLKFFGLYGIIAVFHGLILLIWSDILNLDHRLGFLAATFFQVTFSFFGNKYLVFRK
jgi:putative flippase GtrA